MTEEPIHAAARPSRGDSRLAPEWDSTPTDRGRQLRSETDE